MHPSESATKFNCIPNMPWSGWEGVNIRNWSGAFMIISSSHLRMSTMTDYPDTLLTKHTLFLRMQNTHVLLQLVWIIMHHGIMDVLSENIEKDPPWTIMFADDLVLCVLTREEVGEDVETWIVVFERHGLKISRTKTEYLPSPTNDTETRVNMVDAELPAMTSFKYIGSIFTIEGGSQADVNNKIRSEWLKWKEVSGVMWDRKMPVELKDKVFKTIIRPAMTYCLECWAVKKKDENKLNSAEMRMFRWARGNTRLDHIRNEDIRRT